MNIKASYNAQLRNIAGVESEQLEVENNASLLTVVKILAEKHEKSFSELLISDDGTLRKSILIAVNDEVSYDDNVLSDNDEITFYPAMSGG